MMGISLIIFSLMILLACVQIVIPGRLNVSLASIITVVVLIYYARLNWLLALTVTPLFGFLCWIAGIFSYPVPTAYTLYIFLIALVIGSLVWFAGYFIEGKYPSLQESRHQLFIAPLMMAADVFFMAGRQRELKDAIYGKPL